MADTDTSLSHIGHDLGEFESIYEVIAKYPNGGRLGDFVTIFGVKHYWNEDRLQWGVFEDVNMSIVQMVEDFLRMLARDGYAPNWLVQVFRQSQTQPQTPTGTEKYPQGWQPQPDEGENWWVSAGLIDGLSGEVFLWSAPVRFSGKAANEAVLVFRKSATAPDKPSGTGVLPSGWLAGPNGSTGTWWMSKGDYDGVTKLVTSWSAPVCVMAGDRLDTLQTNIDAEATARSQGDATLQTNIDDLATYVNFMRSAQTLSTVANIPAMGTTTANISASATLSIADPAKVKPGYVMSVRVRNTSGALIYVTLPTTSAYEVDKWYVAAVYPGKVTEIIFRGIAQDKIAITYTVNKNSEALLSPNSVTLDAAGTVLY